MITLHPKVFRPKISAPRVVQPGTECARYNSGINIPYRGRGDPDK